MFSSAQVITKESLMDPISPTLSVHGTKSHHKATGRWTKEEHQRFIEGIKKYGKNWKQVEDYVGTRSGAQIRSHAQKFFNRLEREYNLKLDGSKIQTNQEIKESIRKISEASVSTNSSFPNEGADENRMEEITSLAKNTMESSFQPLAKLVGFESPITKHVFFQESQSVPTDSPKFSQFGGLNNFRRNPRKMSDDVIVRSTLSVFEVIMSKFRISSNGFDFPKLSDLVDMDLGPSIGFGSYKTNNFNNKDNKYQQNNGFTIKGSPNVSFRPHPRKISEDNILFNTKLAQLRKSSFDDEDTAEFEIFSKKIKKD
jgi:SHAQKYF class myb-like DNA-binding protein